MQSKYDGERTSRCTPEERQFLDDLWDEPACDGLPLVERLDMAEIVLRYTVVEDDGELD